MYYFFVGFLLFVYLLFRFSTPNFRQNKRLLVIGLPRAGKTTYQIKLMKRALARGEWVYSNIDMFWPGDLYIPDLLEKFIGKIAKTWFILNRASFNRQALKAVRRYNYLCELENNVKLNTYGFPTVNLRRLFIEKHFLKNKIKKLDRYIDYSHKGFFRPHWYENTRFRFCDDLEQAMALAREHGKINPDAWHGIYWDEGFIDLDWSNKVSKSITNFFNQSGKIRCDIVVSSQRPVAVYPSYRAITTYIIEIVPLYFPLTERVIVFRAYRYFVARSADALPLPEEKGKLVSVYRGKYIFPYFNTHQSVALNRFK